MKCRFFVWDVSPFHFPFKAEVWVAIFYSPLANVRLRWLKKWVASPSLSMRKTKELPLGMNVSVRSGSSMIR